MRDIYQMQSHQKQAYRSRDEAKVAVYEAHQTLDKAYYQFVQDILAFALVGIGALVAYWVG